MDDPDVKQPEPKKLITDSAIVAPILILVGKKILEAIVAFFTGKLLQAWWERRKKKKSNQKVTDAD